MPTQARITLKAINTTLFEGSHPGLTASENCPEDPVGEWKHHILGQCFLLVCKPSLKSPQSPVSHAFHNKIRMLPARDLLRVHWIITKCDRVDYVFRILETLYEHCQGLAYHTR